MLPRLLKRVGMLHGLRHSAVVTVRGNDDYAVDGVGWGGMG
jgi:hypothetical protein